MQEIRYFLLEQKACKKCVRKKYKIIKIKVKIDFLRKFVKNGLDSIPAQVLSSKYYLKGRK